MSEVMSTVQIESILLIGFTVLNIIFLTVNSMMVRFLFALFTLVIAAATVANSDIIFAPYLQMLTVVMSLVCMFLAAKAKG